MLKKRLAVLILCLAVVLFLGLVAGVFLTRLVGGSGPRFTSTAVMLQQVQTLSQLVTVKYVMEKVVNLEDFSKWWYGGLGENHVLMVANGVVKAGLDLSRMEAGDLKVTGKKIVIRLPPAQITDAYLDEQHTYVFERKKGLLGNPDKNLEQMARQNAVDDIRRAARNGGILKDADERARLQFRSFFQQLGFEEVEFISR